MGPVLKRYCFHGIRVVISVFALIGIYLLVRNVNPETGV